MRPDAQNPGTVQAAAPLVCASCAHPLHAIGSQDRCPECGLSVAATRRGRLLRDADPDWRAEVARGAALVLMGPAIGLGLVAIVLTWSAIGVLIGADSAGGEGPTFVYIMAALIAGGLLCHGWWLITHDEPDSPIAARAHVLGWVMRGSTVAGLVVLAIMWLFGSVLDWLGSAASAVVDLASIVPLRLLGLVHAVAGMLCFAGIASRVPNPKMARNFRRSAWLLGIAGVIEGVRATMGWRPAVLPVESVGARLSLPIALAMMVASVALLASPVLCGLAALWTWRQLRRIERESIPTVDVVTVIPASPSDGDATA